MNNNTTRTLKAARAAKGLTQKQLAKKLGIEQATLSNWENDISHVSFYNVDRLCRVLGIDDINVLRGCKYDG